MNIPELVSGPAMQSVLGMLEKKPSMLISDISAEAFVGISTLACGGYIAALKKRQRIYVYGRCKIKARLSIPICNMERLDDLPRPRIDDSNREVPGVRSIAAALEHYGVLTYRKIVQFSGLSLTTVKNGDFLDILVTQRRIHISDRRGSSDGPMSPAYDHRPGHAVPEPQTLVSSRKRSPCRAPSCCKPHQDGVYTKKHLARR